MRSLIRAVVLQDAPAGRAAAERVVPGLACLVTLVAGLALQTSDTAPADKLGDLLYAALVGFGVWFLAPRIRSGWVAVLAGGWCLAVELLQLTGLPGAAADLVPASRLVLGSGFDPLDLVAYGGGVALVVLVRQVVLRAS